MTVKNILDYRNKKKFTYRLESISFIYSAKK